MTLILDIYILLYFCGSNFSNKNVFYDLQRAHAANRSATDHRRGHFIKSQTAGEGVTVSMKIDDIKYFFFIFFLLSTKTEQILC